VIIKIVGKLLRRKEGNIIKSEVAVAWSLSDSGFNTSNEIFVNAIVNVDDNDILRGMIHSFILALLILKEMSILALYVISPLKSILLNFFKKNY
jgi:hypothetical protein